ncbi:hypothetical protein [Flavobacterium sp.]|uniref:hypothetical protein n=1 Tax=Flavobacterium sp. TaxID=239 RepID=UPI003750C6D7
MSLQFIQNEKGKDIGVFIPIKNWEQMKIENEGLSSFEISAKNKNILSKKNDSKDKI